MQKSILISIQPQHVFNILTGKKTLELRKTYPKWFAEGWVYIYCTKSKPYLHKTEKYIMNWYPKTPQYILQDDPMVSGFDILNGQVVARFWFDEWTEIRWLDGLNKKYAVNELMLKHLCLSYSDLSDYGKGKDLYAWHIKKLEVFDKPMALSDFQKEEYAVMPNGVFPAYQPITKAPQSWMFTYTNEQLP